MSLSAHDLSARGFLGGLNNLKTQLLKAEVHAANSGMDEAALLQSQLAPDDLLRTADAGPTL